MTCGCGRDAKHRGRCSWRRRVPVATLEAVREKKKVIAVASTNGHYKPAAHTERLRDLLRSMEEVHLACIDFAHKYKELQRKLRRVKATEIAAADPDLDDDRSVMLS